MAGTSPCAGDVHGFYGQRNPHHPPQGLFIDPEVPTRGLCLQLSEEWVPQGLSGTSFGGR